MGGRSSKSDAKKLARSTSAISDSSNDAATKNKNHFARSKSNSEMKRPPAGQLPPPPPGKPPALPLKANGATNMKRKNSTTSRKVLAPRAKTVDTSKSDTTTNAKILRQKSMARKDSHPISALGREIITQCLENSHADLGQRIVTRMYEKRPDYQRFISCIGKDKLPEIASRLKEFVEIVVDKIENVDAIVRLSREYGEEHVALKAHGFKPDFWVSLVDAITLECIILDLANHQCEKSDLLICSFQPADTVSAWSQLVGMMFSSVRDGYYSALRTQRRSNRRAQFSRQSTVDTIESLEDSLAPPTSPRDKLNRSYDAVYPHMKSSKNLPKSTSSPGPLSSISAPNLSDDEEVPFPPSFPGLATSVSQPIHEEKLSNFSTPI